MEFIREDGKLVRKSIPKDISEIDIEKISRLEINEHFNPVIIDIRKYSENILNDHEKSLN